MQVWFVSWICQNQDGSIVICQHRYIDGFFNRFGIEKSKRVASPVHITATLYKFSDQVSPTDAPYDEAVSSILHLIDMYKLSWHCIYCMSCILVLGKVNRWSLECIKRFFAFSRYKIVWNSVSSNSWFKCCPIADAAGDIVDRNHLLGLCSKWSVNLLVGEVKSKQECPTLVCPLLLGSK